MVALSVATKIPVSEWRREVVRDPRILPTVYAALERRNRQEAGEYVEEYAESEDSKPQYSG